MRHLHPISEDEMVAVFLQTEIASTRFRSAILAILQRDGHDRRVIDRPDLSNETENSYRRQVLGKHRGYRRNADVFTGVPDHVRWYRALATPTDLAHVRYINYDYWTELSGGSRMATDAAVRIRQGVEAFGVGNGGFWYMADALQAGATFPNLILVGEDENSPLTLLEGHVRLTAYFLRPEYIPETLPIIVGYAKGMANK
ncbi:MAG TPA: hypothetical protein VKQ30_12070 [Ktedonobacterales bacterium]|nr:hypothetical protein [Ktedonobacterales bacterium]